MRNEKIFEISLEDLRFHSFHGVMPQEKLVGNEFTIDISIKIPYSDSILNDDIENTISYADIFDIVKNEMGKPRKLIETVATCIAKRISAKWSDIISGQITICKSAPPIENISGQAKVTLFF